jgi:hypothetical protein
MFVFLIKFKIHEIYSSKYFRVWNFKVCNATIYLSYKTHGNRKKKCDSQGLKKKYRMIEKEFQFNLSECYDMDHGDQEV